MYQMWITLMTYDLDKILYNASSIETIVYEDEMDSTNTTAKEIAKAGDAVGVLVLTENQTAGRGRLGRTWFNDGKKSIAMSLILKPRLLPDKVSMITIIAAMAVSDAIENLTGCETQIKWPNDIHYEGKKLCGILTEGVFRGDEFFAVIGIGINVDKTEFESAISISDFAAAPSREDIISEISNCFDEYLEILEEDGDLSAIAEDYNKRSISGKGINAAGELITEGGDIIRNIDY